MRFLDNWKNIKYWLLVLCLIGFLFNLGIGCSGESPIEEPKPEEPRPEEPKPEEPVEVVGVIPATVASDVYISQYATKINQLTGDYDKHLGKPTLSLTNSRYGFHGTDLGVPFQDGDKTWVLFGDTWGVKGGLPDVIGYTSDKTPEDGLKLDFVTDVNGVYQGISIPNVSMGGFEVPTDGIVLNDEFFIWVTTGHIPNKVTMGKSLLVSGSRENMNKGLFPMKVYELSSTKFINVSVVKVKNSDWELLPQNNGESLIIFGSGKYRESHIYLAYQPLSGIKDKNTIRYFAGIKDGKPLWNKKENDAQPIYRLNNPGVGELSASYNTFIKKWILMYNHGDPRGINLRTSDTPWGPWSEAMLVFRPWEDKGYCHFMHTSWQHSKCDNVYDIGRENEWGGEYGPYQYDHFSTGDDKSTTIYFNLSTWNPYTVVLMKAALRKK